ncbi:MAG TPA: DUF1259 domain-containing protein [Gemmatimonadaceae bacterium]
MRGHRNQVALTVACVLAVAVATAVAGAQTPAWAPSVDSAIGRAGALQPGGVYKFSLPRSDLNVVIGGLQLKPALALGSWLGFLPIGPADALVMGDLVLTEDEIGPVMRALQEGGVEPSALHNHLRGDSPRVMYMHVMAHGKPQTIARAMHAALALTGTPAAAAPSAPAFERMDLDTAAIARLLGQPGKVNGIVYQVTIPRADTIRIEGHVIPPSMGVATAINFQPTGGGGAVATGDLVLLDSEVSGVIRALRAHNVEVTALHSHMLGETPRLFFMHFWGEGDAAAIAEGLRAALDLTSRVR